MLMRCSEKGRARSTVCIAQNKKVFIDLSRTSSEHANQTLSSNQISYIVASWKPCNR
jgi:hypothetical protein